MVILRLDLTSRTYKYENTQERYSLLGGRGLIARIALDEIPPLSSPLGPENKLIFAPGLLTGTGLPSTGRLSIGGKSPLTNTIKESNVGGTASQGLSSLGLKAVIIEGISDKLSVLIISEGKVEFLDGSKYRRLGNYDFCQGAFTDFGKDISVLSIGPAGEDAMLAASIAVTNIEGMPSRHAGRGGMGALMGSKGIKGIIIQKGSIGKSLKNPEEYKLRVKEYTKALLEHPTTGKTLPRFGTSAIVNVTQNAGALPTRNFSQGQFEGADLISGESLVKLLDERGGKTGHPCHRGCVIKCSNIYMDKNKDYLTSGLEYETIAMLGSNCGIDDLDVIAELDRLCDDIGIDTIEIGAAVAVAMEGGVLPFGDGKGVIELVKSIPYGTPIGKLLGNGCNAIGTALGVKRIPVVKNQSLAAYDPRALKGVGVTYSTTTMGADHTNGNGLGGDIDPLKADGQIEYSRFFQRLATLFDSLGLCWFTRAPIIQNFSLLENLMNAYGEGPRNKEKLLAYGKEIIEFEREFNKRAGFLPKDDRLPDYFLTEKLPPHNSTFDVPERELDEIHG
jgi:aldehyde:ferredoxin oxidoreductase